MEEPLLQFFSCENLSKHQAEVVKPFGDLAIHIVETLPRNPERTVALRCLLDAKNAAERASIFKQN